VCLFSFLHLVFFLFHTFLTIPFPPDFSSLLSFLSLVVRQMSRAMRRCESPSTGTSTALFSAAG
jgi:hypothetical protein